MIFPVFHHEGWVRLECFIIYGLILQSRNPIDVYNMKFYDEEKRNFGQSSGLIEIRESLKGCLKVLSLLHGPLSHVYC